MGRDETGGRQALIITAALQKRIEIARIDPNAAADPQNLEFLRLDQSAHLADGYLQVGCNLGDG